jgi:regulatory protein YycH of two-component signal transduction system YycFG
MLEKFKSRKFILAALGVVSGIATVLSGVGGTVGLVAAIVVIVASVVTYIVTEGKIDQAAVNLTFESIKKIIELIKEAEKESSGTIDPVTVSALVDPSNRNKIASAIWKEVSKDKIKE